MNLATGRPKVKVLSFEEAQKLVQNGTAPQVIMTTRLSEALSESLTFGELQFLSIKRALSARNTMKEILQADQPGVNLCGDNLLWRLDLGRKIQFFSRARRLKSADSVCTFGASSIKTISYRKFLRVCIDYPTAVMCRFCRNFERRFPCSRRPRYFILDACNKNIFSKVDRRRLQKS